MVGLLALKMDEVARWCIASFSIDFGHHQQILAVIIVVVVVIITKVLIQVTHCKIHAAGALYKITEVQCACQ